MEKSFYFNLWAAKYQITISEQGELADYLTLKASATKQSRNYAKGFTCLKDRMGICVFEVWCCRTLLRIQRRVKKATSMEETNPEFSPETLEGGL